MRVVIPIARASEVVRRAGCIVTITRALRCVVDSAAARMFWRVAGIAITRPGREGTTRTRPLSKTRKVASRGERSPHLPLDRDEIRGGHARPVHPNRQRHGPPAFEAHKGLDDQARSSLP